MTFIRYAEPLVVDAEIEREIPANFPAVLEEPAVFGRLPIADLQFNSLVIAAENQILRVSEIEGFRNPVDRSGKVGHQVPRHGLVVSGQTGYGNVVDSDNRYSPGAQGGLRSEIAVIACVGLA